MTNIQDETYSEAMDEIAYLKSINKRQEEYARSLQTEIDRMNAEVKHAAETIVREKEFYHNLLTRAADTLSKRMPIARIGVDELDADFDLIQELREAAK